ncbi:hypothetical protein [Floridanema evergladense]|uniref:Uncharacterized protein n=1 Tax=Floridaenema evergladense BLCC-F167 TaxID=3153639 RepID=A0ABV4WTW3_9CYAN
MDTITEVLEARKQALFEAIEELTDKKLASVNSLVYCISFIESSINSFDPSKVINEYKPDFYQSLPMERIAVQGNNLIPEEFEHLDDSNDAIESFPQCKRMNGYIRSQLFIALIAELEDYFSQLLKLILLAYPEKLQSAHFDVAQILKQENALVLIEEKINNKIRKKMYEKPRNYLNFIKTTLDEETTLETLLNEQKIYNKEPSKQQKSKLALDSLIVEYGEMKARRDAGIHNNWVKNDKLLII